MSRRDHSGARGLRGLGAGEGHGLAAGQGGPVPGADGDLVGGVVPVKAEVVRGPGALTSPGHHCGSHLALQSTLVAAAPSILMWPLFVSIKVSSGHIVRDAGVVQVYSLALDIWLATRQSHVRPLGGAVGAAAGGDDNPVEEDGA